MGTSVSSFIASDVLLWWRVFWLIRGEPAVGRVSRAATLYSVGSMSDPDHEAAIRFSFEAPRWRAHSALGFEAMAVFGSPPPRIMISDLCASARRTLETGCHSAPVRSNGSSDSRPQRDANWNFSDRHQSPQGD